MVQTDKKIYFSFTICRVRNWALKFGVDLWEFGRQFTKMNDIKNVSVEFKFLNLFPFFYYIAIHI